MQIGKRWSVGHTAPESLPQEVLDAIRAEERILAELDADTSTWGWTLTFLEGDPIVTLDDGTVISHQDGTVRVTHDL